MMRSKNRWTSAGLMALVALAAVAVFEVAPATADAAPNVVSTVSDPVGDARFNAPAYQDVVFAQMTKTAGGDFHLLMEMAGPVPANPPMPPPAQTEIWWGWGFDLDPTTFPTGYPYPAGIGYGLPAEFVVLVSWNGTTFTGTAFDRRPLLTGGVVIITPVTFSINGNILEADLPYALIGDVPPSFGWDPFMWDWPAPVGKSASAVGVDFAAAAFP